MLLEESRDFTLELLQYMHENMGQHTEIEKQKDFVFFILNNVCQMEVSASFLKN